MLNAYEPRHTLRIDESSGPSLIESSTSADFRGTAASDEARNVAIPSLISRVLRQQRSNWCATLAAAELASLGVALLMVAWICGEVGLAPFGAVRSCLFVASLWTVLIALGMYQRHSPFASELKVGTATRAAVALAFAAGVSVIWGWLVEDHVDLVTLLIALVCAAGALTLLRLAFARFSEETDLHRRTLFLGAGTRAVEVVQRLQGSRSEQLSRSVRVVGFVPLISDQVKLADARRLRLRSSLTDFARVEEVDEIVIAADDRRGTLPMAELVKCRLSGIEILDLDAFYEREFGQVALELLLPSWCVFTSAFDMSALRHVGKRAFDLSASLALALSTSWVMLLVAAAILIESRGRGKVLYKQERVGRDGETFWLFKFRSMRSDAELDGVARWAQRNDSRITRVGQVIRKFRLDELPQLWNVFKGEMSIVGPRPERPAFVDGFKLRVPNYGLRHCVRPGLAGWAQLRFPYGASEEDAVEKLRYDLYYVKFQSFRFDLLILLQTVEVVLFGRGGR